MTTFGVSTGDGNMGVSHIFPDYIVRNVADLWELAERAAKSDIKPEHHDEIEVDGDDTCVVASTYDPNLEYCDYVLEVFPIDDRDTATATCPVYQSIDSALRDN